MILKMRTVVTKLESKLHTYNFEGNIGTDTHYVKVLINIPHMFT